MRLTDTPALAASALPDYAKVYGASVREMDREISRTTSSRELIDLTHGDTRAFQPPARAREDLLAAVDDNSEAYSPYRGSLSVRRTLAPHVSALLGVEVDPTTQLIITPGTQGGLFAALNALVSPGDFVAMPSVEYFMDERIVASLGAQALRLPVVYSDDGVAEIAEASWHTARVAGARGVVFSNPNNPTGAMLSPTSVECVATWARANDAWVLADQLYCRLVFDDRDFCHVAALEGMAERTVTLLGPSKTESMSGYRVGVAVAPAEVVDAMEVVMSMASLRTAGYAQHVLTGWMDGDAQWLRERTLAHQALRDHLVERLRAVPGLEVRPPAGSSYVFPDASGTPYGRSHGGDDFEIARALKSAGVVVSPGYQFGAAGRGCFRINFSQDPQRLEMALDRIAETLS